ncbi:MAG: serine/threonine protein kinase [Deltaproteobacteria bacterium]|nr:serine/threonine protein kinase [Deltaproteobacteria bacterium]
MTAETMVGAVLNGKWRLTRLLGEGGMGAVFAAEGMQGQGPRAIKVLHPEFVNEPQILDRFSREAVAAQQLDHPNVARVFEHAQAEDGSPYLVMELLQGIPLANYVQPGKAVPVQQAAPIIYGVLQALVLAHSKEIVHRDLKPDNIFLVPDSAGRYTVKVLDFGIAKVMDAAGGMGSKTRTGVLLGTPGYMSPEQIKNAKAVDPRSDLWSVGIIFYEMVTGEPAFDAPNDFARLTAVLTQDPKPIASVAPHLAMWGDFFAKATARDANQRYANADEMARALLFTSRAQAGAAMLPTNEFRSVAVQQKVATMQGEAAAAAAAAAAPARREGSTQSSPQLPDGVTSMQRPPVSVQVISPPSMGLDQTMKSGPSAFPPSVRSKGMSPAIVAVIAAACLAVGFAGGFATAWLIR